jgi:hypothetical protein
LRLLEDTCPEWIAFSEHQDDDGEALYRAACKAGLEGIMAKRKGSRYASGRSKAWVKVKNPGFRRFSRPTCSLAMSLNDQASERQRQRLLPYVTRLACADTPEIERERERFIAKQRGTTWLPFDGGVEVLEGALAIGRQADPLGPDDVRSRIVSVQQSLSAKPSRFRGWFATA